MQSWDSVLVENKKSKHAGRAGVVQTVGDDTAVVRLDASVVEGVELPVAVVEFAVSELKRLG